MNVVIVVIDDAVVDTAAYMPNLQALDPIVFPNSFVTTPLCAISRASIFTGRYALNHPVHGSAGTLTPHSETFAVPLAAKGWDLSLVGKYNNGYPWGLDGGLWQPPGWTDWHGLNAQEYYDYGLVENGVVNNFGTDPEDYVTDVLNDRAVTFVQNAVEPFCLYLAHWAPHGSTVPSPAYEDLYVAEPVPHRPSYNEADISDKPSWLRNQYPDPRSGSVQTTQDRNRRLAWEAGRSIDDGIDAIHDALVVRGIDDDTAIIVIADNSNFSGEHRLDNKGAPYEENLRMMMHVVWPGVASRTEMAMVANIDIAPTLMDIAGPETYMPIAPDGMSLKPLIEGDITEFRENLMFEWWDIPEGFNSPDWQAVRTFTQKWAEMGDGTGDTEFYDLITDPYELTNDAANGDRGLAAMLATLRAG